MHTDKILGGVGENFKARQRGIGKAQPRDLHQPMRLPRKNSPNLACVTVRTVTFKEGAPNPGRPSDDVDKERTVRSE